jgi:co-chaperonin GroES (HSP10)
MIVKPLRDKIIVKPEPRVKSLILDTSLMAEAESIGTVVAVGDDAKFQGVNVGDRIMFGTLARDYKDEYLKFEELNLNGERHLKMSWQDICAVIEETP